MRVVALFDALLGGADFDDALDEDAGRVDLVGIHFAGRDEMLDLGHRDFAAVAIIGLKLRAVLRYTRLPAVSPFQA